MEIRKMQLQDYKNVYSLWMTCTGMGLNIWMIRGRYCQILAKKPDTCFVAMMGAQIIGVILVGSDGRRGYIYHTAVHPDFRHSGIARQLVDRALNALESIGINKAALVVFKHNEIGNGFWERLGFTVRDDLMYRNKVLTEIERIDT